MVGFKPTSNTFAEMKRYFLQLSYKGTRYVGWQIQPNGLSIQEEIEKGLSAILRKPTSIVGQGRTDAGVHALKSYAHFDWEGELPMPEEDLTYKLNRILSKDIAVQKIFEVAPDAHARFSAVSREYIYIVAIEKTPFNYENSWMHYRVPNLEKMQEACAHIMGEHDFSSFCSAKSDLIHKVCTVTKAEWTQNGSQYEFRIKANRFVMNMVRSLVGTMTEIGLGKRNSEDIKYILEQKDRSAAGVNADPAGLHLYEVAYPDHIFTWKTKE